MTVALDHFLASSAPVALNVLDCAGLAEGQRIAIVKTQKGREAISFISIDH
jgi:hypothetical protein